MQVKLSYIVNYAKRGVSGQAPHVRLADAKIAQQHVGTHLALDPLPLLPRLFLSRLLSLHNTRVAAEQALRAERAVRSRRQACQRLCHAKLQRLRLPCLACTWQMLSGQPVETGHAV